MLKTLVTIFYLQIIFLFTVSFGQNIEKSIYPKIDVNAGMSYSKGSYVGSTIMLSNKYSIEMSYGGNVGLFLVPTDSQRRISFGLNYHILWPMILNCTYTFMEQLQPAYFKGQIISANVGLLSLRNKGIHFFISAGLRYQYENKFGYKEGLFAATMNIGIGFTFL
ncbi:MAG: hypothetical protein IPM32_14400 [Ignavibacteriae bacterium]|nr:hypothetical protein [Ignavibacteriota bacterium]